jgi:hypothetical protein
LEFKKKPYQELVVQSNQQTIPNPKFKANKFKEWLLGKNYRSIWTSPVQAPVLDLTHEKGGLKVIQRGEVNKHYHSDMLVKTKINM